jgi:energy-coupling factor transport system permease protein
VRSFRYRDKGTPIHKLNPFCKIAWIGSLLVLALILNNPFFLFLLLLSTLPLVIAARVWREWLLFMKFALYLCIVIIIINALVSSHGSHVLVEAPFRIPIMGSPVITLEAIFYGVAMSLRLLAIISAFAILTLTVHPDDMMLAMIRMKLPYKSVLVTSLSTRFIPTLIDDAERITDVQRSRGLELNKGKLLQKVSSQASIVIALLSNSLDRATQVAEAMESRAFGAARNRTYYKEIGLSFIDVTTLVFVLLPCVLGIFMSLSGYGQYQYYPTIQRISLSSLEWSLLALLMFVLASILPLAYVKQRVDFD